MARRGPKPEPASVKLAKGNSGRRPIGADPVIPDESGAVVPPAWMKAKALDVWKRLAPRLVALKLLGAADAETFGRYCTNFARWVKMQGVLDKEGEFYESESVHGKLKRIEPAFAIADRLEKSLSAAEDRFGLNPAERQRIFAARAAAGTSAPNDLFGATANQAKPGPQPSGEAPKAKSPVGYLQ
ncbi:MAG: phage terminase small subunit P27 family [Chelatococcus sp.]|uniref:phage terminase small subunit P27 family n=1 Tax=Chelatococcus sp. TaxID=1953771 RepID=UPI0025C202FA|nr:phage terminase small subunit P27 family [Chelatococcus sp.]MBX3536447.1 phage terminase small subunit P27 family [Chelatococcus sp.]